MQYQGKWVYSVDFDKAADYPGDFMEMEIDRKFHAVWCSHVLEHQRNVGTFLEKLRSVTYPHGTVALVVPRQDPDVILGGHITVWSIPLLLYNLVMAGYDCSRAQVLSSYEISVLVSGAEAAVDSKFKNSVNGDNGVDVFASIQRYLPIPFGQGSRVANRGGFRWGELYPAFMPKAATIHCKNLKDPVILEGVPCG